MQSSEEDWNAMLERPAFRALTQHRRKTVVVLGIAAALYYFSIPALIAFAPAIFTIRLLPGINLGSLFVLSQYPFGILLAYVFLRRSARLDGQAAQLAKALAAESASSRVIAINTPERRHAA